MEGLPPFEQAALDKLLAGNHPVLAALRTQAKAGRLSSRELTGVGFYCDFEVPPTVSPVGDENFHLGDVEATVPGLKHGAGFVLFVTNGRLTQLEGYSYDEPWPEEIHDFELRYQHEPRRLEFPHLAAE